MTTERRSQADFFFRFWSGGSHRRIPSLAARFSPFAVGPLRSRSSLFLHTPRTINTLKARNMFAQLGGSYLRLCLRLRPLLIAPEAAALLLLFLALSAAVPASASAAAALRTSNDTNQEVNLNISSSVLALVRQEIAFQSQLQTLALATRNHSAIRQLYFSDSQLIVLNSTIQGAAKIADIWLGSF